MLVRLIFISILFWTCATPVDSNPSNISNSLSSLDKEDQLEIVTWNIENFPKNGNKTIDSVATIMNSLNADIYCLQEVSNEASFLTLMTKLENYNYIFSTETEYLNLAIIYKESKIVFNESSSLFIDNSYEFASRPPLKAEFTFLKNGGINFTLINLHLKCCDSGFNRRVASVEILYNYLNTIGESGFNNHIVVGDWNDDVSDPYAFNSFNSFIDDSLNYKFVTFELANSISNLFDSYPSYPSFIDHILITNDLFDDFENSRVQTLRLGDYISNYDELISDHRPVVWSVKL